MNFDFNLITLIGFVAQGLFFSRFAVQLFLSEKAKASLSPTIFWQLSLFASCLMISYGFLRDDFSIVEGQLITYFIYIRNLHFKGFLRKIPKLLRILLISTPFLVIGYGILNYETVIAPLLKNPSIPLSWLVLGTVGQSIFASRFIYQWLYSEHKKESIFPLGFWIISSLGAILIIIYAIFVKDIVLIVGQVFGLITYGRNFYLRILENKDKHTNKVGL